MEGWGTYEVIGDTINASIYYLYSGSGNFYRQPNFQGIIKNKNTILDWHVVEPYPKMNKSLLRQHSRELKKHQNLYFVPVTIKPFMDSISEKAWVNKYRNKK
jgi:hypothetical protein